MPSISNYEELLVEKARLKARLNMLQHSMHEELAHVREKYQPVGGLLNTLSSMTKDNTARSLATMGANVGIELLLGSTLAKAGWLARIGVPLLLKGVSGVVMNRLRRKKVSE